MLSAFVVFVATAVVISAFVDSIGVSAAAIVFAFAGVSAIIFAVAVIFAVAIAGALAVAAAALGFTGNVFSTVAITQSSFNTTLIVLLTVALLFPFVFFNFVISRHVLSGGSRNKLIRDLAVGFSSWGGTSFRSADLTGANFSRATVKSAHFKGATLTRTRFHLSKELHLSRVYNTSLANRTVLDLLVSLHPDPDRSYVGLNLQGANLSHAQLADINLTGADLSDATLEGADMQRANLAKAHALGTRFRQTILDAACLESWNIDSRTQLDGAICDHVYLLQHQQERRPSSGTFAPGEFAELFK